jgi:hypothetical protein
VEHLDGRLVGICPSVLPIVSGLSTAFAQLILMPGYGDLWGYIGANVCP